MDFDTFSSQINALVSEFMENSGCPSQCANLLQEIARDVFEQTAEDMDTNPDPGVLWYDTSAELD
jgi:hypothetical protein